MPRTLTVLICVLVSLQLSPPTSVLGQSIFEEAVTGILGRTAKIGRNILDLGKGEEDRRQTNGGVLQTILQPSNSRGSGSLPFRPEDGTVVGGLFRGFMRDVDDSGNVNKATLLHPDQHQVVGGLIGGLMNGGNSRSQQKKPAEEEVSGVIESMMRRRKEDPPRRQQNTARRQEAAPRRQDPVTKSRARDDYDWYDRRQDRVTKSRTRDDYDWYDEPAFEARAAEVEEPVPGLIETVMIKRGKGKPSVTAPNRDLPTVAATMAHDVVIDNGPVIRTSPGVVESLAKKGSDSIRSAVSSVGEKMSETAPALEEKLPPSVLEELDALRRDVARDAPQCSLKAKAQLSKVLANFRQGVLDCVGVDDADLADVLNRLRQVLLTADRLPTSLVNNLNRCASRSPLRRRRENATLPREEDNTNIARIPPKRSQSSDPAELSAARCIIQALADARDRFHKLPTEAAAFSRKIAFLLAGTKSDARVRACVASQLTAMAHPLVASTRQLAGCVMVGPDFTTGT